jgi:hypothetical protein
MAVEGEMESRENTNEEGLTMNATYLSLFKQVTGNHTDAFCDGNVIDWDGLLRECQQSAGATTMIALTNHNEPELLRLAESPQVSSHTLTALAFHRSVQVRCAVADHGKTPLSTLLMLTQDESEDLRYQLAENHNVDDSVLLRLVDDVNPFVACRAERTLARRHVEHKALLHNQPLAIHRKTA